MFFFKSDNFYLYTATEYFHSSLLRELLVTLNTSTALQFTRVT